jgi:hypothetical protein
MSWARIVSLIGFGFTIVQFFERTLPGAAVVFASCSVLFRLV